MTSGTKTVLYVLGGVVVLGVGVVGYAYVTDKSRLQGPTGDPEHRNAMSGITDLLEISRSAAQAYREADRGGGGAGDSGAADTSLYDAAGGSPRGARSGESTSQY